MYQNDDFSWDDLDGGFYESMSRSTGHTERWLDGDGNEQKRTTAVFTPEDGDDHHTYNSDLGFGDDGLSPVRMLTGHDPDDYTSLTDQYIDFGGDQMWAHGIYQTDNQDDRELRDNGLPGSYNTGERERRDKDMLLDPGARKLRDRQRIYREGHRYNDRKLAEQINRMLKAEAEYELEPEYIEDLVQQRREKTDLQYWIQECGGHKGKPVGERRAQQIVREITEELDDEQRDAHKIVTGYRAAREAGWVSPREKSQLEPASKWAPYAGDVRQQYDPSSSAYSRKQMASIASQLLQHDGDVTKVRVPIERSEPVNLILKATQSADIARHTDEFLSHGGHIEQVAPAEDSWTEEFRKKMKYRWLRWNRW